VCVCVCARLLVTQDCWFCPISKCEGLPVSNRYTNCVKAAIPLPFQDFAVNLRGQLYLVWRELDGAAPRTHHDVSMMLTNSLLIMHGWPCLSSQALCGALPSCCLDTCSWNWAGMCFVTLLVFACVPESRDWLLAIPQ